MEGNGFGKYTLSEETLGKLQSLKDSLGEDLKSSNSTWKKLFRVEDEEKIGTHEKEEIEKMEIDEEVSQKSLLPESDDMIMPSTQFYFSQSNKKRNPSTRPNRETLADVIESLFISLEQSNGFLDSEDVKNLTDANAVEIIDKLSQRLSHNGVYNLCCTVCDMETTLATYYAGIICSNLLLKKILDAEKIPDLSLLLTIGKIVPKFPDEVRKSLFVPLLIADLKSTKIIEKLISNYPQQSKKTLTTDFIETVKDLKIWHITILPSLIDNKIEEIEKNAILSLFVDKALNFGDQKDFGQCIMSFMKKHAPFTEEQRNMLHEIIVVNKTIWQKPMQNLFDKMFFHRDLWHIS